MPEQPPPSDHFSFHSRTLVGDQNFFNGQHIISDQIDQHVLCVIWQELQAVVEAGVRGAVVEFGCYVGTTSLYIRRLLDTYDKPTATVRQFHVYDSFAGLPAKQPADLSSAGEAFQAGKLSISKKELLRQFKKAGLQPPIIHKGWFSQLLSADVPDQIAFAFLDGDFYESIMDSLKLAWPRMTAQGTIVIDDYAREALPGVERAVHDFFNGQLPTLRRRGNLGIITVLAAN